MYNFQNLKEKSFFRTVTKLFKVVAVFVLVLINSGVFIAKTQAEIYAGIFMFVFITLPTIFIIFVKEKFIKNNPGFSKWWKILRIIYILVILIFLAGLAVGYYRFFEKDRTQVAVEFIKSQKITIDDVMGKNLPPVPDQALNDSTLAGIDQNNNGIRDDVELAIFKKYPKDEKIRAAELQYALALQLELTQVFNSETLVAVMQEESRGSVCIGKTSSNVSLKDSHEKIVAALAETDTKIKEVDNFVVNTELRKKQHLDVFDKYMTGYASLPGPECDVLI